MLRELIPGSLPSLLSLFGITAQGQRDLSFVLDGEVKPVALVGSLVTLTAQLSPPILDVPFTQGEQAAPLANALLADTGALAAGNYIITATVASANEAGDISIRMIRRNAADAADIWSVLLSGRQANSTYQIRVTLLANERIRLRVGSQNTGAGSTWQGAIWVVSAP